MDKESAAGASVASGSLMAGPSRRIIASDNPDLRLKWKRRAQQTVLSTVKCLPGLNGTKVSAFVVDRSVI